MRTQRRRTCKKTVRTPQRLMIEIVRRRRGFDSNDFSARTLVERGLLTAARDIPTENIK